VSGIRAETLQTIYADKTVQVFTAAIDKRGKKIFDEIQQKRANEIDDYTVEAAISDATEYHAACTLIAALEGISKSLEQQPPPEGREISPDIRAKRDFILAAVAPFKTLNKELWKKMVDESDLSDGIKEELRKLDKIEDVRKRLDLESTDPHGTIVNPLHKARVK
jgi:hypothetical protein